MHMSLFKNIPRVKVYYSDTDSVVTNVPLPDWMVGSELGQVKLEYVVKSGILSS